MAHSPPEDNGVFATRAYWDARFAAEDEHDWLNTYAAYADLLRANISPTDRILVIGCGNSTLSARLYEDGCHDVCNVDYSAVVIDKMARRHADMPGMSWVVMDIRAMAFADAAFDVVLDKGTLDALFAETRSDPWNPSPALCARVDQALREVSRVLRDGGRFLSISFGQPHFRRRHLLQLAYGWDLSYTPVGVSFHYFVYRMLKGAPGRPTTEAELVALVRSSGIATAPRANATSATAAAAASDSDSEPDVDTFFGKLAAYDDSDG